LKEGTVVSIAPSTSFSALRLVNHEDHQQLAPSGQRVECPQCFKLFTEASVVSDAPIYRYGHGQHVSVRRLYCDHCNHIVVWEQASNKSGTRFGQQLGAHAISRSAQAIERFLRAHPEAAGVLQV
jgi:hypothetical protein